MQIDTSRLSYSSTGYFSAIIQDYLEGKPALQSFYAHPADIGGIQSAIKQRATHFVNRKLLVDVLQQQYHAVGLTAKQSQHLQELLSENTFTVCTAHQPNLFTGHLYFIYKILHAVKLADELTRQLPGNYFVPVYYMGSEDADLDELGHVFVDGGKYEWKTDQKGAVGRMKVDKSLLQLIDALAGRINVLPHGEELTALLRQAYTIGTSIEEATFVLVNQLFAEYGLLILLPDNRALKNVFAPVMQRELLQQFSHTAVEQTVDQLAENYKVQAAGRDINLFYLQENSRERIEKSGTGWTVVNTEKYFTEAALLDELENYSERFSPNVILRPVFQEMILPNVAFIGGGGEIAYWLELKKVFEAAAVPYPVLVLRNSFLYIGKQYQQLAEKLNFDNRELFSSARFLTDTIVKNNSSHRLSLAEEKAALAALYEQIKNVAGKINGTLATHTNALHLKALDKIEALEKKMLRAEKQKFEAQQRQISKLKNHLFPNNNLQERVDNFMLYYAQHGKQFLDIILEHSLALEQEFVVLTEK